MFFFVVFVGGGEGGGVAGWVLGGFMDTYISKCMFNLHLRIFKEILHCTRRTSSSLY